MCCKQYLNSRKMSKTSPYQYVPNSRAGSLNIARSLASTYAYSTPSLVGRSPRTQTMYPSAVLARGDFLQQTQQPSFIQHVLLADYPPSPQGEASFALEAQGPEHVEVHGPSR
ncbi:hypothetical protein M409DRAFT_56349 [Zasmidium cellare ATCC 36951]|uniref:Uncharacterized protein n=1 Tax=Zasmidium cellare ATCC 36951 TaxID=1080233 RepID=A0A6A6CFJ3_ZASCE|nr:uncharacterized protein M409DRAFT_56349 [Zasmidium cellare ATCC 36951]KAF2165010.1 hypothetical protein M409DRAFT_56349 [Zasmidium cellare ATCC 36951]